MTLSKIRMAVRFAVAGVIPVGPADATTTLMTANPPTVDADGVDFSTITVQAKDSLGQNLTSGGDAVALFQDGSATLSAVTDNGNGTYTATITNNTVEPVIVTGTINLVSITDTVDNLTFVAESTLLTASRVSGVAPLSVYFEDDAAVVDSTLLSSPFSDIGYFFDFDDVGSGNWDTNGLSRNSAIGPLATHVFETPGSYTVTLTAYNLTGVLYTKTVDITITDPEVVFATTATTVVTSTAHNDFTGAPSGATQIVTDDINTVTQNIGANERLLFARGASWTVNSDPTWINSSGVVNIGAFGTGSRPLFTMGSGTIFLPTNSKQDWRTMDLEFSNVAKDALGVCSGGSDMQRLLFLRIKVTGMSSCIGWSHWNQGLLLVQEELVAQDCEMSDFANYGLFVNGEKSAYMGNTCTNSDNTHICRVQAAYKSTFSNNKLSGSSLLNSNGRHALKFHGPKESEVENPPTTGNGNLPHRTKFAVISGNIFGSSGSWPVAIGPQDGGSDERLTDILVEGNTIVTEYGQLSPINVAVAMKLWGRYITARNNVFDGTGSGNDYTGIQLGARGVEPAPIGCKLYNNTIYRSDNTFGNNRYGFIIDANVTSSELRNNLVSFPNSTVNPTIIVQDLSADTVSSNNLLVDETNFVDPDNVTPLSRDFHLTIGSGAIGAGIDTNAFKDFDNLSRVSGSYDIGAYKYV